MRQEDQFEDSENRRFQHVFLVHEAFFGGGSVAAGCHERQHLQCKMVPREPQIIIKHTLDPPEDTHLVDPEQKRQVFWHLIWWREYQQERTSLLSSQRVYSRLPPSKQRQLRDKKCSWWPVWVSPQNSTTIFGMGRGSYIANCWDTGLNQDVYTAGKFYIVLQYVAPYPLPKQLLEVMKTNPKKSEVVA